MPKTLWSRDFTLITLSTILSAIGQEAMNFMVTLLVFEETQSAFLSAFIYVVAIFPDVFLSLFAAPLVDRMNKKKWVVYFDILLMITYIIMGMIITHIPFTYWVYVIFVIIVACLSVLYRLGYNAWYPDLIPIGFEQKGYAVSGIIYPTIIMVMTPISAFLFEKMPMQYIFYFVGLFTFVAIICKSFIKARGGIGYTDFSFSQYKQDMKEGFDYIRKEKGIRNIFLYMSITSSNSEGVMLMTQAHYQTSPLLSVTMLATLKSAEMIGRLFGGIFQYSKEIPVKLRFLYTKFVYATYNISDAILLFSPYPLAIINRFICGALGNVSATIRESATQSYIPANMRARVQGFFGMIIAICSVIGNLINGLLGEIMPYPLASLLLSGISMCAFLLLIVKNKEDNRKVYEATRTIQ